MKNVHLITKEQEGADVLHQYLYITSDEDIKEGDWVIAIEGIWKNTITKITGTPITDVWMKIILTTDPDLIAEGVQPIDDEFLEWFVKNPNCEYVEVEKAVIKHIPWDKELGSKYDFEKGYPVTGYKIIIPQEEPKQLTELEVAIKLEEIDREEAKLNTCDIIFERAALIDIEENKQETLEEAAEKYSDEIDRSEDGLVQHSFIKGAEWQAERMYSELELEVAFFEGRENNLTFIEWFEQFKK